jgi:hypothetical protein
MAFLARLTASVYGKLTEPLCPMPLLRGDLCASLVDTTGEAHGNATPTPTFARRPEYAVMTTLLTEHGGSIHRYLSFRNGSAYSLQADGTLLVKRYFASKWMIWGKKKADVSNADFIARHFAPLAGMKPETRPCPFNTVKRPPTMGQFEAWENDGIAMAPSPNVVVNPGRPAAERVREDAVENILGNMRYHQDRTLPEGPAVWVFGSNLFGAHHGGAAKVALEKFGAKEGVCRGVTGKAYAIPTADRSGNPISLKLIDQSVVKFIEYANATPNVEFFVTRVGCGIVGYKDKDIGPMFQAAPANRNLPEEWGGLLR